MESYIEMLESDDDDGHCGAVYMVYASRCATEVVFDDNWSEHDGRAYAVRNDCSHVDLG